VHSSDTSNISGEYTYRLIGHSKTAFCPHCICVSYDMHSPHPDLNSEQQSLVSILTGSQWHCCELFCVCILFRWTANKPAISRRALTTAVRFRFQASQCETCGEQIDTRTGFSPSTSVSFHQCSTLIFSCMCLLSAVQLDEAWDPAVFLGCCGTMDGKVL
jgi:hypothetical protein